ncbi:NAD-dependent epimerase/dehydratase family protein [Paramicrobacterium agarici]|uniref:NAD-dependent epimerase/dehydratase family protein n=1 Tax=Paramicrobacterium agarici TaxID=630514 RepID=UPI001152CC2F|nr:NAD-dependent epimerase/dehydratase family protein [Microbacterium agarici]TQO22778.1 nucleoside-diphosphate-sugar epimerase [Microbacterium agarici]
MNNHHVIVGAGPVGRHVAEHLVENGNEVVVATRSGRSTGIPGVTHLALDATDADALSRTASGAAALYNCANPGNYTVWDQVWPPLSAALLEAAERSGAVYAITGTLYPYGPVDGPMREGLPDAATDHKGVLRARLWADAKAAHDAARVRAVEVRGSDYVGSGVGDNGYITRQVPGARRGKTAWVFGSPDLPHTFTDVRDVARTLVAAALDASSHGRIWHVPSNAPRTQRETLNDVFDAAGITRVPVRGIPQSVLTAASVFSPFLREVRQLRYEWTRPYVLDDRAAREHFGIEPTPWDEVCLRTASVTRQPA